MVQPAEPEIVDPPIRAMTRLLAEMQTSIMHTALPKFCGDVEQFGLYVLALRQSMSGRTISNSALSASLGLPLETARRKINELIARDILQRTETGLAAGPATMADSGMQALIRLAHDSFVRLLEDLDRCGAMPRFPTSSHPYLWSDGVQAAADLMLAVATTNNDTHRDWTDLVLFSTVLCANQRRITADPELARLYATASSHPPMRLIAPVSSQTLASVLAIPRSTVARRVSRQADVMRREPRGLVIAEEWLDRPEAIATSKASYANLRRLLATLAQKGFPFGDIPSAYLDGRPPPVDFEG